MLYSRIINKITIITFFKLPLLICLYNDLSTCEIYECDNCFFRVKVLSEMEDHMDEKHTNENLTIIHGKVDRKNENFIKTTQHLRNDLFA